MLPFCGLYTPPFGAVKPVFSQQMPATESDTTHEALLVMAFTASSRLLPSEMNERSAVSWSPPMKLPLESAETACLENASSIVKCLQEGGLRCGASPRDRNFICDRKSIHPLSSQYKFALEIRRNHKGSVHFLQYPSARPPQGLPRVTSPKLF